MSMPSDKQLEASGYVQMRAVDMAATYHGQEVTFLFESKWPPGHEEFWPVTSTVVGWGSEVGFVGDEVFIEFPFSTLVFPVDHRIWVKVRETETEGPDVPA